MSRRLKYSSLHLVLWAVLPVVWMGCDSAVDAALPDVPTMVFPANGSADEADAVELQWNSSARAEAFQLQLSTDPGFSAIVKDQVVLTSVGLALRDLEIGRTYYWRVRAGNDAGFSDWTDTWSFRVAKEATIPLFPALKYPAPDALNMPQVVTFEWEAGPGANAYHLQVSLESNFQRRVADMQGIRDTRQQIRGLVPTYIYFWRVRSMNPLGFSSWSPTWRLGVETSDLTPPQ